MKISCSLSLAAFFFVLLFGPLLGVRYTASAQDSLCPQLSNQIYSIQKQSDAPTDSVRYMLDLIAAAQRCYKPDDSLHQIWLLGHEVDGLDKLNRYAEAEARIEDFFDNYRQEAKDRDFARMYLFQVRLRVIQGDLQGATVAYRESLPYLHMLEPDQRLQQLLNGSHIYMKLGEYEGALDVIRDLESEIASRNLESDSLRARILVQRGTIILRQESAFDLPNPSRVAEAVKLLHRASDLYKGVGAMEQHISALATYGMALSLEGKNEDALTNVDEAIRLAEEHRFPNVEVYARYQRGEINYNLGDYNQAGLDLARASTLMEEKEIDEYGLPVYAVLGKVYEAQELTQRARSAYERALVEAKGKQEQELIRMAQRAEISLVRLESASNTGGIYGGLALALAVLIGLAIGMSLRFNFRHVSRPIAQHAYLEPHLLPPMPRSEPPSLFDRRVGYIYAVLENPKSVLPCVDDPFLIERIEKNDIQRRSILYALAAALETEEEGTTFDNDPANTFGTYLRKWFKKYDLTYPADLHGWRLYFSSASDQNPTA